MASRHYFTYKWHSFNPRFSFGHFCLSGVQIFPIYPYVTWGYHIGRRRNYSRYSRRLDLYMDVCHTSFSSCRRRLGRHTRCLGWRSRRCVLPFGPYTLFLTLTPLLALIYSALTGHPAFSSLATRMPYSITVSHHLTPLHAKTIASALLGILFAARTIKMHWLARPRVAVASDEHPTKLTAQSHTSTSDKKTKNMTKSKTHTNVV